MNDAQARQLLMNPRNKEDIDNAKYEESKLRVFTESLEKEDLQSEIYWSKFNNIIKSRSDAKHNRLMDFATYPLPIIKTTDNILDNYFRLYEGKNRYFDIQSSRDLDGLNKWVANVNLINWIETNSKKVFKNKPCSFVVVDVDSNGIPYPIFIDSERLIDAEFLNEKGDLKYISFIHSVVIEDGVKKTYYGVYDEENYHVFVSSDSDSYVLVSTSSHNLGYCPAISMTIEAANTKNLFKRKVLFTTASADLEKYTMFDIYENYVDHYAPFPVTEAPEKACVNPSCESGEVSYEQIVDVRTGEKETFYKDCSSCGGVDKGQHIMPGTHIAVPIQDDNDTPSAGGVFKMHIPDTDKLKYIPEKLDSIRINLVNKTVGINTMSGAAINEMQVKGSFVSMDNVLIEGKKTLDRLYKWIVKTSAKLIYNSDIDIYVTANFGTEFHLMGEEELQNRFEKGKEIGLPIEELIMIYTQLIETKYKDNEQKLNRQKMILDIDPLPLQSIDEAIKLKENGLIDEKTLNLKVNFTNLIRRFERENLSIEDFGKGLEYRDRVEIIIKTIKNYQHGEINIEA